MNKEDQHSGTSPGALVREYVHLALTTPPKPGIVERWQIGLQALDQLAELIRDLPPVDAVQIAREVRDELNERPLLE